MQINVKLAGVGLFVTLTALIMVVIVLNYQCPLRLVHTKIDTSRSDIIWLESAVKLFKLDIGRYPTLEEGLNALIIQPENIPSDWQQYLSKQPVDRWGNRYLYINEKRHDKAFQIYSKGPDGIDNGGEHDDVVNWHKNYDCQLYKNCLTFCERANKGTVVIATIALLSLIALSLWLLYFFVKQVINRRKK